jgi:hypothetical protein
MVLMYVNLYMIFYICRFICKVGEMKKGNYKAGVYKQQYEYKSFTPSLINTQIRW